MNPIDISAKPDTIEHVHVGKNYSADESEAYKALFKEFHDFFSWSYEEMSGIDPSILVHEIKTYPMAKPVRKKLRQSILERPQLLKLKSRSFSKLGLFILCP